MINSFLVQCPFLQMEHFCAFFPVLWFRCLPLGTCFLLVLSPRRVPHPRHVFVFVARVGYEKLSSTCRRPLAPPQVVPSASRGSPAGRRRFPPHTAYAAESPRS